MAIMMMLIAAGLIAAANFFMRRSIDAGGSTRAYLVVQLFISFLVAIALSPARTGHWGASMPSIILGLIAGVVLGAMMWSLGRALEHGPPGLTFASLNSATVMPAVIMAILFGVAWGHTYTWWNGIGSLLVVGGLFWAGWQIDGSADKRRWATLTIAAFVLHIVLLVILQWRALMLKAPVEESGLLPFRLYDETGQWFFPMIFAAATIMQLISYLHKEKRWPGSSEVMYGVLGGITNGACTFFLVTAPEKATPWENAMIFPIYAVTIIILCNLWGQAIYKERVNWLANGVCLGGLAIGTINWSSLFG